MDAIIDNDILSKGACYGLLGELISGAAPSKRVGILGSARFVVPKSIERTELNASRAQALKIFALFINQAIVLEPAVVEQQLAADLELAAQKLGINLDVGESQLCAILCTRLLPVLMTGDKRAIIAVERLLDCDARLAHIAGKILCLEQLFSILLKQDRNDRLRTIVCAEPLVDKALSNCFGCHSHSTIEGSRLDGLQSYIAALRNSGPRVLAP